jgi:hypothetical protein
MFKQHKVSKEKDFAENPIIYPTGRYHIVELDSVCCTISVIHNCSMNCSAGYLGWLRFNFSTKDVNSAIVHHDTNEKRSIWTLLRIY